MTPGDFITKWRASELKESSAAQEHFIDLCRLLNEPTPAEADPKRPVARDETSAQELKTRTLTNLYNVRPQRRASFLLTLTFSNQVQAERERRGGSHSSTVHDDQDRTDPSPATARHI